MGRLRTYATKPRIWKYQMLSTCSRVTGSPLRRQPLLLMGPGQITIGEGVQFGWETSQGFHIGYCHVEASTPHASVQIGDRAEINNDVFIKSEGPGIVIGADALLGSRIVIYDSDFHELDPRRRRGGTPAMGRVELGENVFIGDRVMILKGVTIGAHSVVGAGSVVTGSIPSGVIAVGNPARVVRELTTADVSARLVRTA
jgi:acetyltransferase-like isoleucine patch superfamily enzyme